MRTGSRELEPFGARLRAVRESLGLSQEGLAGRAGLTREEINKIENGRNKARSARIQAALAHGLGLAPDTVAAFIAGTWSVDNVKHWLGVSEARAGLFPGRWSGSTWAALAFASTNALWHFNSPSKLDELEKALRKVMGSRLVAVDALDPEVRSLLWQILGARVEVHGGRDHVFGTHPSRAGKGQLHAEAAGKPKL